MTGDEQPVSVKQRQRVQQHVTVTKSPGLVQRDGVGSEIVVTERRALRLTGGARSVENGGDVVAARYECLEAVVAGRRFHHAASTRAIQRDHFGDATARGVCTDVCLHVTLKTCPCNHSPPSQTHCS